MDNPNGPDDEPDDEVAFSPFPVPKWLMRVTPRRGRRQRRGRRGWSVALVGAGVAAGVALGALKLAGVIWASAPAPPAAAPAAKSALACGDYIDGNAPVAPLRVVLGVVALPVSPRYPALQTSRTGEGGALRLFAKTGLVIRPGTSFELIVPAAVASRLGIGWGMPGTPSDRVVVSDCANPGGGWLAYPGGYWIDHPACVPIIVRADGRQQEVHIGLGTPCPGQQPPQGPSQT